MYELKKKLGRYLRVNLLGPGPRLMKKEFTGLRSHRGLETLIYSVFRCFMLRFCQQFRLYNIAPCCSVTDKPKSIRKEAIIACSRKHPDILKDELKPTIKKKNFVLPGYYTASSGNSSQKFRDNLTVPSSRDPLKMGPKGCPETSVRNHE